MTSNQHSHDSHHVISHHTRYAALNGILWLFIVVVLFAALTVNQWYSYLPALAAHNIKEVVVEIAGIVLALLLFLMTKQRRQFVHYLKGVKAELVRVVWPTKNETLKTTWIVLAVVVVSAVFLSLVDKFFAFIIQSIVR